MNNFEPKYIKISAHYLQKKLTELQINAPGKPATSSFDLHNKKKSTLSKLFYGIFKS